MSIPSQSLWDEVKHDVIRPSIYRKSKMTALKEFVNQWAGTGVLICILTALFFTIIAITS